MLNDIPNLYTIQQFCDKHQIFKCAGLRNKIFNAKTNGMEKSKCIVRIGKRIYIHEKRFFDWVESLNP